MYVRIVAILFFFIWRLQKKKKKLKKIYLSIIINSDYTKLNGRVKRWFFFQIYLPQPPGTIEVIRYTNENVRILFVIDLIRNA